MDDYGIYTAADDNFFPGVVVQLNALRLHGYMGRLAVIDTGLAPWMREYLSRRGAIIIPLDFTKQVRFSDVLSDETAGMRGWSFKAFGIMQARLFRCFTFIDADYIPLCNLQAELHARVSDGEFLCTEDGSNIWDESHADAIGVRPGTYMNVNAGFFSASMDHHGAILEEWRNLMTRRKPFDLWYGDQGALNAVLDKYGTPKVLVGDKSQWNQTSMNAALARDNAVTVASVSPPILRYGDGRRIFGWHGCGWCRYWHCIGIDHYRQDKAEIDEFRRECAGKVPQAVLELFSHMLFYDDDLVIAGHLIGLRAMSSTALRDIYSRSYESLTDKGTAHSYIDVYEELFAPYRDRDVTVAEIGVAYGGSLLLWNEYFASARIIGIDKSMAHVLPAVRESRRIRLVEGDVMDGDVMRRAVAGADIVIDDGSHEFEEQMAAFRALAPRLKPGGLYIIEDIWPYENALRFKREIPDCEIVDRRHIKGRADDVMALYRKPGR
jgi:hypothetical protein